MSYHQYVNNKINYLKLKDNIYLTKNDFIFDKNIDYELKCKKYENKIRNLIGGVRIGSKILPDDISKSIFSQI
jgi:hypothetical protein